MNATTTQGSTAVPPSTASSASAATPRSPGVTRTDLDGGQHIDVTAVGRLLDGRWAELRRASRDLALDPELQRDNTLGMAEHRERVLSQLHLLVTKGD
ncbi:hypothetical protein PU560_08905, partial [Georgenia sp. 10Sc9-8]|nr:hypothetical protein [Georgenia halotolerans]